MKKTRLLAAIVLMLFLLSGCSEGSTDQSTNAPLSAGSFPVEMCRETYFAIVQVDDFSYAYRIYNREGEMVRKEMTESRLPEITMLSEDIVDIRMGYGTGLASHLYYDVNSDRFSDVMEYVIASAGRRIAYMDIPTEFPLENRKIVIRDIFDETAYYQEVFLNFAKVDTPVVTAAFSEDGSQLLITYLKGDKQSETSEIIDLA